jgi:hypothetical protein
MSRSTVVDNSPHQPEVEGSNPAAAAGSGRNKTAEKVDCPEQIFFQLFSFFCKNGQVLTNFLRQQCMPGHNKLACLTLTDTSVNVCYW